MKITLIIIAAILIGWVTGQFLSIASHNHQIAEQRLEFYMNELK